AADHGAVPRRQRGGARPRPRSGPAAAPHQSDRDAVTGALVNGRTLLDGRVVAGKAVVIEAGRIAAVVDDAEVPAAADRHDLGGGLLVPGFIDTQVNGGGGALFNDAPTVETIATIGRAHRAFGTTGFLPTLISDDLHVIQSGI